MGSSALCPPHGLFSPVSWTLTPSYRVPLRMLGPCPRCEGPIVAGHGLSKAARPSGIACRHTAHTSLPPWRPTTAAYLGEFALCTPIDYYIIVVCVQSWVLCTRMPLRLSAGLQRRRAPFTSTWPQPLPNCSPICWYVMPCIVPHSLDASMVTPQRQPHRLSYGSSYGTAPFCSAIRPFKPHFLLLWGSVRSQVCSSTKKKR